MNILQQTLLNGINVLADLGGAEKVTVLRTTQTVHPVTETSTNISSQSVTTTGFVNKPTAEEILRLGLTQQQEFIYTLMGGPLTDKNFIPKINDQVTSPLMGTFKLSKLLFFDSARAVFRFAAERVSF